MGNINKIAWHALTEELLSATLVITIGGSGCARRCFGDACRQGGGTPRTRTAGGQGCGPLLPTMASTTPMLPPTRGALWTAREPIRRDWEDCWYSHPQASEGPKGVFTPTGPLRDYHRRTPCRGVGTPGSPALSSSYSHP